MGTSGTYYYADLNDKKTVFSTLGNTDFQHVYSCEKSPVFTGKEKDSETGYYYFGARYYDSDLSGLFLSVDPMSDKYPNMSPYAYCAWNPVKLVDPDGRECIENHDPYLIFNGATNKLQIWDDNNTPDDTLDDIFLGEHDAHNNVDIKKSKGKWEDGEYEMETKKRPQKHPGEYESDGVTPKDSPSGRYGTAGCFIAKPFKEKGGARKSRSGMAVHAGREHKPFFKRITYGCIRVNPETMEAIQDAIDNYGPLQKIIIINNRAIPQDGPILPPPISNELPGLIIS